MSFLTFFLSRDMCGICLLAAIRPGISGGSERFVIRGIFDDLKFKVCQETGIILGFAFFLPPDPELPQGSVGDP